MLYGLKTFLQSLIVLECLAELIWYMSRGTAFPIRFRVRPTKTQIRLCGCAGWSESSLGALCGGHGSKASSDGQRRLWSAFAGTQADQSLRWAHMQVLWEMLWSGSNDIFVSFSASIDHSFWKSSVFRINCVPSIAQETIVRPKLEFDLRIYGRCCQLDIIKGSKFLPFTVDRFSEGG